MERKDVLLKGISKSMHGIEIAPWHNPVASKKSGYNVLSLDIFDTETLLKRASSDPNIPDEN